MKVLCTVELEPDEGGLAGVVRIPPEDVQRLLRHVSERPESLPKGRPVPRVVRAVCERDPDIRQYLESRLREPATMDDLREGVRALVGKARCPSRTAIAKYVRRRRIEIGL